MVRIDEKNEEMICNFGAFNYSSEKIAAILGCDVEEIEDLKNDENSQLNKLLKKGRYLSEYAIDKKLFEMARAGDIKALEKLTSRNNPLNKFNENKKL